MLARWLGLAALAAAIPVIAGCGGAPVAASETAGNQLTIYSSLPLQGESAAISQQLVNGEKLALSQAGGQVGPFKVAYVSLDDANPANGQWTPVTLCVAPQICVLSAPGDSGKRSAV